MNKSVHISRENGYSEAEVQALLNKKADNDTHNYKTYSSVADLGLVSGSATIAGIWAALPTHSMLICNAEDFLSGQVPNIVGTVEMVKGIGSWRGRINFYSKAESVGDYRMYLTGSNTPTGTWHRAAKIYTSVQELGLTYGSATITQAWNAMSSPAILIARDTHWASAQLPYTYGTVEIVKYDNDRGYIHFYSAPHNRDHRMYLTGSSPNITPTGVWVKTNRYIDCGEITAVDIPAGSYHEYTVTFNFTFPSNPIVIASFVTGTTQSGFGKCTVAAQNRTTTGCTIRVYNGDTSQRTPGVTWIAIYP